VGGDLKPWSVSYSAPIIGHTGVHLLSVLCPHRPGRTPMLIAASLYISESPYGSGAYTVRLQMPPREWQANSPSHHEPGWSIVDGAQGKLVSAEIHWVTPHEQGSAVAPP